MPAHPCAIPRFGSSAHESIRAKPPNELPQRSSVSSPRPMSASRDPYPAGNAEDLRYREKDPGLAECEVDGCQMPGHAPTKAIDGVAHAGAVSECRLDVDVREMRAGARVQQWQWVVAAPTPFTFGFFGYRRSRRSAFVAQMSAAAATRIIGQQTPAGRARRQRPMPPVLADSREAARRTPCRATASTCP